MSNQSKINRPVLVRLITKIILIAIGVYILFAAFCAYTIWDFGDKNQVVRADAAVVLGAAVTEGKPSPVFRERINHAIWLYQEGDVRKIIFTGGTAEGSSISEAEAAREYAVQQGVNAADILTEDRSHITSENLRFAKEVAESAGLEKLIVVSDPLHMKRAMLIARIEGLRAYSSPTTTSAYHTLSTQIPFLLRETFFYTGYLMTVPFR